ncbi:hypothetical protein J40TS1_43050 [Paenibacillus montaniterrae]|uniref:HTH luxR-type domain-containing protein n=1 Tax=Paenibacillus montaniterrae TaxID=429341 RepID=A0A919YXN0_9BACL|nr:helix-turn-helix transcriptional regulator [Paenibacillus montaniterrae]GIP18663.1 hypothetical protein J40TS1_43050 [Paenibacillus montaniterrae]
MTLTFRLETEKLKQPWKTLQSLDNKLLKKWELQREASQDYYVQSYLRQRVSEKQLKQLYASYELLRKVVQKHCEDTLSDTYKSILFILTTTEGIALSVFGSQKLVQTLNRATNLGEGSIFTIQNAGVNAINISIALKGWVFLSGAEHDLSVFKQWNCFCAPVRQNGEIIGYLDMSCSVKDDHLLMASLFALTHKRIEEELNTYDQRQMIYEQFESYRLSPREKEVGYMWLNNYSALRIASELGIAEGTVRTMIKRIYRKTRVSDKGQFIRKFITS